MVKDKEEFVSLNISVFVISDTRNERSDKSGKVLENHIIKSGHKVFEKKFIQDDKKLITKELKISLNNDKILCNKKKRDRRKNNNYIFFFFFLSHHPTYYFVHKYLHLLIADDRTTTII